MVLIVLVATRDDNGISTVVLVAVNSSLGRAVDHVLVEGTAVMKDRANWVLFGVPKSVLSPSMHQWIVSSADNSS